VLGVVCVRARLMRAACGDDDGSAGAGEPIKIGVNVKQSAPASVLGGAYADAATLRARMINEQGGIMPEEGLEPRRGGL
jgi:ABC-type branched-subunit amino acid transport system substrate-binding protein